MFMDKVDFVIKQKKSTGLLPVSKNSLGYTSKTRNFSTSSGNNILQSNTNVKLPPAITNSNMQENENINLKEL